MGSVVTDYTIYRNNGNQDSSSWTALTSYTYMTDGYVATIDTTTDSLTPGKFYFFVYKATNMIGDSILSKVLSVPVADQPL